MSLADAPKPQPSAGSGIWNELVEQFKNQMTPMYWFMLDDARGILEGDEMTVLCGDDLTLKSLQSPDIAAVIRDLTAQRVGHPIRLRFVIDKGGMPAADKLDELIRQGSKYDSFTVKP